MKIQSFRKGDLRNDAHFQFHSEFRKLIVAQTPAALNIQQQFAVYMQMYEREDEAFKRINKSEFTEQIHKADAARDEIYSGMTEYIKAMCKYPDIDVRPAARRVKIVLDTYGNIAAKPINEQTSAIYNLVQELRSDKYSKDLQSLTFAIWVDELKKRNDILESLVEKRYKETADKSKIIMKAARAELDKAYRSIVERINAIIIINGPAGYESFVRTINAVVAKYCGRYAKSGAVSNGGGGGSSNDDGDDGGDDGESSNYYDAGGGSHGGGAGGGAQYEIPLYDPSKHYSEYQLGDVVRMPNGAVYRVKDLGHVHYTPDSENGHFGWEKVY